MCAGNGLDIALGCCVTWRSDMTVTATYLNIFICLKTNNKLYIHFIHSLKQFVYLDNILWNFCLLFVLIIFYQERLPRIRILILSLLLNITLQMLLFYYIKDINHELESAFLWQVRSAYNIRFFHQEIVLFSTLLVKILEAYYLFFIGTISEKWFKL